MAPLTDACRVFHYFEILPRRLDEPWTLDSMAEASGIGRSQFANLSRKTVNLTPMAYLGQLRMDRAATLLTAKPGLSVTDIAFGCGFQSSQYFGRAFRPRFGHAPSALRRG